jgi:hypothetical protein
MRSGMFRATDLQSPGISPEGPTRRRPSHLRENPPVTSRRRKRTAQTAVRILPAAVSETPGAAVTKKASRRRATRSTREAIAIASKSTAKIRVRAIAGIVALAGALA